MTQKYSNQDHMLKFDDDMRIIHDLIKDVWCDEFNKKATKLTVNDQKLLTAFTEAHKSAAVKAFYKWEDEKGAEPANAKEAEKQNGEVYKAIRKSMKPK